MAVEDSPETNTRQAPANGQPVPTPKRPKKKGKNLAQIHSKSLPLEIHPLPAFQPSNPLSLLRLAYTWISHILFPPPSHLDSSYVGYFSPETRSVHITDPRHVRALWEMGFFGKGTLSRSEPSWLEREKARLRKEQFGPQGRAAAEDATVARREVRRLFKLERARLEREQIERQRMVEAGKLAPDEFATLEDEEVTTAASDLDVTQETQSMTRELNEPDLSHALQDVSIDSNGLPNGGIPELLLSDGVNCSEKLIPTQSANGPQQPAGVNEDDDFESDIYNQEHLQLTLEEAFFLSYGLGVLSVYAPKRSESPPLSPKSLPEPYANKELLPLFCQHSLFPSSTDGITLELDDQFMLNYVAYHHFRSLGWVVRSGLKFSADYLLYNRGPAFSHAEFAVLVIPSYSHRFWNTPGGRARRQVEEQKDWWWLHCVNRVQSQVKKTLVLCYVDIPSPWDLIRDDAEGDLDIGKLLRSYKVREFVVKRWLANRSRD